MMFLKVSSTNNFAILYFFLLLIHSSWTAVNSSKLDVLGSALRNYDKTVPPVHRNGPVEVGITMYVLALSDLDEKDMTFSLSVYFRHSWIDERFANLPLEGKILLTGNLMDKIWVPDTFIVNEVFSYHHTIFVPNQFVRLDPKTGNILQSGRYTITASCPMDFQYFPFDEQICALEIESFGYTLKDVLYKWKSGKDSIGVSKMVQWTPSHLILGHRLAQAQVNLTTGSYSRIWVEFMIGRFPGRYLLRFFVPMMLFVTVSLVSIWVLAERTSALINLLNMCFINLFMVEGKFEPAAISYKTSIDVFFTICLVHILLCLIDTLVASFVLMKTDRRDHIELTERRHNSATVDDHEVLVGGSTQERRPPLDFRQQLAHVFATLNLFIKAGISVSFMLSVIIFFPIYSSRKYSFGGDNTFNQPIN